MAPVQVLFTQGSGQSRAEMVNREKGEIDNGNGDATADYSHTLLLPSFLFYAIRVMTYIGYLGLRGKRLQSAISLACGLCFLCFGYAQGVMGGLLTVPAFLEKFPEVDTINNSSGYNARVQGAVVGVWNLGCFVSAILTIFIGDDLGRRKTLMIGLTFWVFGEIVQASSFSFGQFVAGRAVAGFGNGFITSTVPAYQAECVKSHRKGTILMISAGAFIAFGLALSYWLVFGFAYLADSSIAWRVPIAFQVIFALVAILILLFMPESPRWLILTGREEQALRVLAALNDEDIESAEIRDEFLQIKDAILVMAQGSSSSLTSNKDRRNFHRVVLAYFVQVFQQMSGINLLLQYLAIIMYTQVSYTGWLGRLIGASAASFYFLSSFMAVIGIDRFWGRRWLMLFGATGMCGCMILCTVLGYLWKEQGLMGTDIAQTVFIFAYLFFFAFGWQGMAWLYQVEIVPLRIRGSANALSTSANWLFNFIVVFIGPIAFHNVGWRTYIIFAATNFVIIPIVFFFYPETAYRSLEEVDVLFHLANETPGNPWTNVVKISINEPLWYGRKGEVPFDYENSDWHRRYQDIMSGGSGTTLEGSGGRREKSSTDNGRKTRRGRAPTAHTDAEFGKLSSSGPEDSHSSSDQGDEQSLVFQRQQQQQQRQRLRARSNYERYDNPPEVRHGSNDTDTTAVTSSRHSSDQHPARPPLNPLGALHTSTQDNNSRSRSAMSHAMEHPGRLVLYAQEDDSSSNDEQHQHQHHQQVQPEQPPHAITSPTLTAAPIIRDSTESTRPSQPIPVPRGSSDSHPAPEQIAPGVVRTASGHWARADSDTLAPTMSDGLTEEGVTYLPENVEAEVRDVLGRAGVVLAEGDRVVLGAEGNAVVRPGTGMGSGTRSRSSSYDIRAGKGTGRSR